MSPIVRKLLSAVLTTGLLAPAGAAAQAVEGYAWPLSVTPGETIGFHVSGAGRVEIEFMRHKAAAGTQYETVKSQVLQRSSIEATVQPTNAEPHRNGAGWAESFSLKIPGGWRSGIYSARLVGSGGDDHHITFIVKPVAESRSRLAVLANVNTWLAYNRWSDQEDKGKYPGNEGDAIFSFLRPNPAASPVAERRARRSHPHHLTRGELWILSWLEDRARNDRARFPDVYTDIDFHNDLVKAGRGGYHTLVLSTHPEYWSKQMYGALRTFLKTGGSLLYLGGNGIYENAEYIGDQKYMSFRAGVDGGPRSDALFRRLNPPMPERAILGVATERCGVGDPDHPDTQGGPYEVLRPDHPFFRGLVRARRIGDLGWNTASGNFNGKASAWEVDTRDGEGALGIPTDCASGDAREFPVPTPQEPECRRGSASIRSLESRIDHFQDLLHAFDRDDRDRRVGGHNKAQLVRIIRNLNSELALEKGKLKNCSLPPGLQLLARGQNWCDGAPLRDGECPRPGVWKGAEMVYYNHPGGGFVLSVGSITFGGSLVRDPTLQSITLRALAEAERRGARLR